MSPVKYVKTSFFPLRAGYSHGQVSFIKKSASLGYVHLCEEYRVLQSNKVKKTKSLMLKANGKFT